MSDAMAIILAVIIFFLCGLKIGWDERGMHEDEKDILKRLRSLGEPSDG